MQQVKNKSKFFFALLAACAFVLGACNREFEDTPATAALAKPGGSSLGDIVNNDTAYSFFKALVAKAGPLAPALSNTGLELTAFIPNNNSFRAFGVPSVAVVGTNFSQAAAVAITNYAVTPQLLPLEKIPTTFPNLQSPTLLNPTAGTPAFSPFVSLSIFPSKRATAAWVNNIPLVATNIIASNGIVHVPAVLVIPPSATLWSKISTDPDMTYFRAAVIRGDSGQVGTARFDSLLNLPIGPNFTVFVPTNVAFQQILTAQITGALIAQGMSPADAAATATALASTPTVFANPLLARVLTPQTVKGLVVYHILGVRAFSVNLPTTATPVPTLLNSAVPSHPGVVLNASFTGPSVSAATVKGAANATPSNLLINPAPAGTSDQHYLNGVLHKINQVLRPQ